MAQAQRGAEVQAEVEVLVPSARVPALSALMLVFLDRLAALLSLDLWIHSHRPRTPEVPP